MNRKKHAGQTKAKMLSAYTSGITSVYSQQESKYSLILLFTLQLYYRNTDVWMYIITNQTDLPQL